MKHIKLLLLMMVISLGVFAQTTTEPVTFRLDLNDVIASVPNSDSA